MISTISGENPPAIKVWPEDDGDPQLPKDHGGKIWFLSKDITEIVPTEINGER